MCSRIFVSGIGAQSWNPIPLEMRQAAVDYYLAHGKSLVRTMRKMGYPASREYLCDWIDELAPGQRKYRGPTQGENPSPSRRRCRSSPS